MTAAEICAKVNGALAVNVDDASATGVYVGDLLSDVMGHAGDATDVPSPRTWRRRPPAKAWRLSSRPSPSMPPPLPFRRFLPRSIEIRFFCELQTSP